jgi:hypothetical protein
MTATRRPLRNSPGYTLTTARHRRCSSNAQIEFLLRRALALAGRLPKEPGRCAGSVVAQAASG